MKNFILKLRVIWDTFVGKVAAISVDKYLHFIAGAIITGCTAFIPIFAPYGWVAGMIAGILKECIDKLRGGLWDKNDFLATLIGSFVGQIFLWIYLLVW